MSKDYGVICLCLDDGKVQPLAWTDRKISTKQLRRATKQFRHDADVVNSRCMHWTRLYRTVREMQQELPQY